MSLGGAAIGGAPIGSITKVYTFTLLTGAVAVTGVAQTISVVEPLGTGALAISGSALSFADIAPLGVGALAIGGSALSFSVVEPLTVGAVAISGLALSTTLVVPLTAGSVAVSGLALSFADIEPLGVGALAISGSALSFGIIEPLGVGALTISGSALLLVGRFASLDPGSFPIVGSPMAFADLMPLAPSAYSIVGSDIGFTVVEPLTAGAYGISGSPLTFSSNELLLPGTVAISGLPLSFVQSGHFVLGSGVYSIVGFDVSFTVAQAHQDVVPGFGAYIFPGDAQMNLELARRQTKPRRKKKQYRLDMRPGVVTVHHRDTAISAHRLFGVKSNSSRIRVRSSECEARVVRCLNLDRQKLKMYTRPMTCQVERLRVYAELDNYFLLREEAV